ncbi:MAG: NAD(P)/FAD-dependent oxidoreductase [Oscillospiraceae bacterium]|nr:NAD(P)/FAD-dependent oxidoreductase [Oscillospiraceae bacterium]
MTSTRSLTADLIVVGAGPAGLMAAITAARRGLKVIVADPNPKAGKKLRITGKGRCNVTSDDPPAEFLENICTNARFFKSAFYAFPPSEVKAFFEKAGVPLKTERGERVFPVSDNANDVADALCREARNAGVTFIHERVREILTENGAVSGVQTNAGKYSCRAAAICTGGLSYPGTGSTGDGYRLAEKAGHTIVPLAASLVPWEAEECCGRMQGLSLRNVTLSLLEGDRLIFREQGEMLFTHYGVSGPLVLTASTYIRRPKGPYRFEIDLKPGLTPEKLDERLLRDFSENANRDFVNALDALLPKKLIPVAVERSGIPARTKVNTITRAQRLALRDLIKAFPIALTGPRSISEAIITAGGVDVKEVQPRTMESKLLPGLFFAGEVLDIDGRTGGYNLQIAWSTGYTAGRSVPLEE